MCARTVLPSESRVFRHLITSLFTDINNLSSITSFKNYYYHCKFHAFLLTKLEVFSSLYMCVRVVSRIPWCNRPTCPALYPFLTPKQLPASLRAFVPPTLHMRKSPCVYAHTEVARSPPADCRLVLSLGVRFRCTYSATDVGQRREATSHQR